MLSPSMTRKKGREILSSQQFFGRKEVFLLNRRWLTFLSCCHVSTPCSARSDCVVIHRCYLKGSKVPLNFFILLVKVQPKYNMLVNYDILFFFLHVWDVWDCTVVCKQRQL